MTDGSGRDSYIEERGVCEREAVADDVWFLDEKDLKRAMAGCLLCRFCFGIGLLLLEMVMRIIVKEEGTPFIPDQAKATLLEKNGLHGAQNRMPSVHGKVVRK